jgi:hypothetical protein
MKSISTHIRIVAWLHILLGSLSLLGGILVALIFGVIGGALASGASGHALPGILAFFGVGTVIFILIGVFAIPHFIVAWGLLNRVAWARIVGIIVSILSLLHPAIGLGTAIAIYSLIVLFSSESEELFRRAV